jgi:dipeptidyl aminopeptidase/acylaminoacyl peptidase
VESLASPPEPKDQVGYFSENWEKGKHLQNYAGQTAGPGAFAPGKDTPTTRVQDDKSPGTGPYPAQYFTDDTLKAHTIYAPKTPPKGVKLPVLVWGNGGCGSSGTSFQNLLREVASYGFIVLANGPATGGFGLGQTKMTSMTESLDWVMAGANKGKYGDVDSSKIAVGGQSCGGMCSFQFNLRGLGRLTIFSRTGSLFGELP